MPKKQCRDFRGLSTNIRGVSRFFIAFCEEGVGVMLQIGNNIPKREVAMVRPGEG